MAEVRAATAASVAAANLGENNISEQPLEEEEEEQQESRRPKATAFKQQRLPAWQPILTAGTVLPTFFIIGIIFIPLGIGLLITSENVHELQLDYTECTQEPYQDGNVTVNSSLPCSQYVLNMSNLGTFCNCKVQFEITENFAGPVYLYYGLTNYYQNHRRYVRSRDDYQLTGDKTESVSQLSEYCEPFRETTVPGTNTTLPVAPCGAISNSFFNDSISLTYLGVHNNMNTPVPVKYNDIAWTTDKSTKFNNPSGYNHSVAFEGTYHPPNWHKFVYELDPDDPDNNGYENEDFIVWMRTAALPYFRKLYRRIDHQTNSIFEHSLPDGLYEANIQYAYPVTMFEGTKRIIISTSSWLGGKNIFLGVAYIVTGSLCILFGCIFLCIHLKHGKRHGDLTALS
uniref:Cell cycle control protein 50A-like n=1 Tax=Saccoglossus kowalevskii TaxID=10224 RepID=A0ABM0LX36_SACKO|nr:PREDICTED: cell cycle control protein 50A-like [Saccoglossus kowalevskii]